jgi:phosphoadenosine phosphosulfate reductase
MAETLTLHALSILSHDQTTTKDKHTTSKMNDAGSTESGYASAASSSRSPSPNTTTNNKRTSSAPAVSLTDAHIEHLNAQLEKMHPRDILRFARVFFPNLYQSTAFGLTGLVTLDMLSKLQAEDSSSSDSDSEESSSSSSPRAVPLIFLDTLHHFPETYALVDRVRARYPDNALHVFKPREASTPEEFRARYGEKLHETDAELYDYTAKVEPLQRAYEVLDVAAVLTGRRRSQGGARGSIPVLEVDSERGVVKINPLATWSFGQVKAYVDEHNVPYNELLDRGYKSIGDWHSTVPVKEGEDERAGRWKDQQKTECGIHNSRSRYAQFLQERERRRKEQEQQQQQQQQQIVVEA